MANTVLVVDDEDMVRTVMMEWLESAGYQALTASSGYEGLRILNESRPDVVVSDVWMPGMNGYTFCRLARRDYHVPVVLVTGVPQEARWFKELDAEADDYLVKPTGMRDFLNCIENLLARRRRQPESAMEAITV